MIRSFRSKGLAELFRTGKAAKVRPDLHSRALRRLDALNAASDPEELNIPGFDFHPLKGHKPTRYTIHINGPWCITFEWADGDALHVDLEQYHQNEPMNATAAKRQASRAPTHPGAILREDVLPALRLSVSETARRLHVSRQTLHDLLAERKGFTPEMALRIDKLAGNGPVLWLRMQ